MANEPQAEAHPGTHELTPGARVPPAQRWRIYVGLFAFAVALRAATAYAIARTSGVSLRNLALFYDGHVYILISKTLPSLYATLPPNFPRFPDTFLTGWFPVYPVSIRLWSLLSSDVRLAALLASWFAGGLAVVLFHEVAREHAGSPAFAAFLFAFLPYTWLLSGSLALVESTLVCVLLACILALRRGRVAWAALGAALAIVTQKSGFLLLPILLIGYRPRSRLLWPSLAAISAAATLQGYLWWLFSDPLVNIKVARNVLGVGGEAFGFPFSGFVNWAKSPMPIFAGLFWPRKVVIVLETATFIALFLSALRRPSPQTKLLVSWLGVVLLFYSLFRGPYSFYGFPRYMVMASPAAILLGCRLLPATVGWRWWVAAGFLLPLTVAWTVLDSHDALDLCLRIWKPEYFRALIGVLQ